MCSNAACTSLQARDPFEQEVHNLWNSDPGKKRKTKAPKARPPNNNPKKTKPPNNKPNPHLNQVCYLSKRIVQRGYPHPPPLAWPLVETKVRVWLKKVLGLFAPCSGGRARCRCRCRCVGSWGALGAFRCRFVLVPWCPVCAVCVPSYLLARYGQTYP